MSCDHRYRVVPVAGTIMTGELKCRKCGDVREGQLLVDPSDEDRARQAWELEHGKIH